MNSAQAEKWDKWFASNRNRYAVCWLRHHLTPITHVSIMVSKYYDVEPYELMQIHEDGTLVPC